MPDRIISPYSNRAWRDGLAIVPALSRPWKSQPSSGGSVTYGNLLANGLVLAINPVRGLVNLAGVGGVGSTNPTTVFRPTGVGHTPTSTAGHAIPARVLDHTKPMTVFVILRPQSGFAGGSIIGNRSGGGFAFNTTSSADVVTIQFTYYGVADYNATATADLYGGAFNKRSSIAGSITPTTTSGASFYLNGAKVGNSVNTGTPEASTANLGIYQRGDSGGGSTASVYELVLAWNRALSDAEHRAINDNPWQLFAPRQLPIPSPTLGPFTDYGITTATPASVKKSWMLGALSHDTKHSAAIGGFSNEVCTSQPQGVAKVNWNDPINRKLVGLLVGGGASIGVEIVNNTVLNVNGPRAAGQNAFSIRRTAYVSLEGIYSNRITSDPKPTFRIAASTLSFATLVHPLAFDSSTGIFDYGRGTGFGWSISQSSLGDGNLTSAVSEIGNSAIYCYSSSNLILNKPNLVVVTKAGTGHIKLYLNGINVTTGSAGTPNGNVIEYENTFSRTQLLGSPEAYGSRFIGHYGALWDRELSAQEIQELANNPWRLFQAEPKPFFVPAPNKTSPIILRGSQNNSLVRTTQPKNHSKLRDNAWWGWLPSSNEGIIGVSPKSSNMTSTNSSDTDFKIINGSGSLNSSYGRVLGSVLLARGSFTIVHVVRLPTDTSVTLLASGGAGNWYGIHMEYVTGSGIRAAKAPSGTPAYTPFIIYNGPFNKEIVVITTWDLSKLTIRCVFGKANANIVGTADPVNSLYLGGTGNANNVYTHGLFANSSVISDELADELLVNPWQLFAPEPGHIFGEAT